MPCAACCLATAQGLGADLASLPGCDGAVRLLGVREVRHTPLRINRVKGLHTWPSTAVFLCGGWLVLAAMDIAKFYATVPTAASMLGHLAASPGCLALLPAPPPPAVVAASA